MSLLGFFGKKNKLEYTKIPVESLRIDMHNHILFGIDDGCKTLDLSMEMVDKYLAMGFEKVIASPHIMAEGYKNSEATILPPFKAIQEEIESRNLDLKFEYAAEYYLDENFEKLLEKGELLGFSGNHVLIETSIQHAYRGLGNVIFEMGLAGYQPIWAHPERYFYMHPRKSDYMKYKDQGALFQVNLLSFMGQYGPEVKEIAEWMLEEDLIDLVGTDAHHPRHLDMLNQAQIPAKLAEKIKAGHLLNARL